jgi:hypothetical protein
VGETEKHLHTLFAEAEDANAIIFFDEAEALFSRRGEVKEAQDRWANMETNYLLQRIEEYTGVVILASNLRQNIDAAFSGGNIKNIVLDATYRALDVAEGGRPTLTLRQLVAATAREYEKLGKPLTLREFGPEFFTWVEQDIL